MVSVEECEASFVWFGLERRTGGIDVTELSLQSTLLDMN